MAFALEQWVELHFDTVLITRLMALHEWATRDLFECIYASFEGSSEHVLLGRDRAYVESHRDSIMQSWEAGNVTPAFLMVRVQGASFVRDQGQAHAKFSSWIMEGMPAFGMDSPDDTYGIMGFPVDFVATPGWYRRFVADIHKDLNDCRWRVRMAIARHQHAQIF